MNDKVISLLGLAERAGKIASGEFAAEKAVKTGKARLIIVAEDASDNTKKKFSDMCKYYQVPFACYSQKELLGHGIGKEFRASLAVLDGGFAESNRETVGQ